MGISIFDVSDTSSDPRPRQATAPVVNPAWDPHGPAINAQIAARAALANRSAEVKKAICELYPQAGQAIKIRMKATGKILAIGYEPAFCALVEGRAELLKP